MVDQPLVRRVMVEVDSSLSSILHFQRLWVGLSERLEPLLVVMVLYILYILYLLGRICFQKKLFGNTKWLHTFIRVLTLLRRRVIVKIDWYCRVAGFLISNKFNIRKFRTIFEKENQKQSKNSNTQIRNRNHNENHPTK